MGVIMYLLSYSAPKLKIPMGNTEVEEKAEVGLSSVLLSQFGTNIFSRLNILPIPMER